MHKKPLFNPPVSAGRFNTGISKVICSCFTISVTLMACIVISEQTETPQVQGETVAPGTGIDLEFETDGNYKVVLYKLKHILVF